MNVQNFIFFNKQKEIFLGSITNHINKMESSHPDNERAVTVLREALDQVDTKLTHIILRLVSE